MTMDVLLLRLDAPLMSFGGSIVDHIGVTREFPALSMLTGLLGNAIGYDHRQSELLERIQKRLHYSVRCDQPGIALVDYQTVDLGQDFLRLPGWTTRGFVQERGGGESSTGTHIRLRHYLADARYTIALTLEPADEDPTLDRLEACLEEPERPLYIGRKPCLPSSPILLERIDATDLVDALRRAPLWDEKGLQRDQGTTAKAPEGGFLAWWPEGEVEPPEDSRVLYVTDSRDWTNQIHVRRRCVREGRILPKGG